MISCVQPLRLWSHHENIAVHGLKLAVRGLKLAVHGLKLAVHGLKLAVHELKLAVRELKLAVRGLKLAVHGLKRAAHPKKIVASCDEFLTRNTQKDGNYGIPIFPLFRSIALVAITGRITYPWPLTTSP